MEETAKELPFMTETSTLSALVKGPSGSEDETRTVLLSLDVVDTNVTLVIRAALHTHTILRSESWDQLSIKQAAAYTSTLKFRGLKRQLAKIRTD